MPITLIIVQVVTAAPSSSLPAFVPVALLDLLGLSVAIWGLWASAWTSLTGPLLLTFRLIACGSLVFALSHVLDTLMKALRLLSPAGAGFLHLSTVLLALLIFVPSLASLPAILPRSSTQEEESLSPSLWPLPVMLTLTICAISFIGYGINLFAAVWASIGLNLALLLLSGYCLIQVLRTSPNNAVGLALRQTLVGLLIFSLAHPLQTWMLNATSLAPATISLIHRLIVIPAFLFFAYSMGSLPRVITRSGDRPQKAASLPARSTGQSQQRNPR